MQLTLPASYLMCFIDVLVYMQHLPGSCRPAGSLPLATTTWHYANAADWSCSCTNTGSPAAEAAAGEAAEQTEGIRAESAGSAAVLTIEHIESTVKVLNTKTRPKRLQFLGSDGHTYGFPPQGELRLSEQYRSAIMQDMQARRSMLKLLNRLLKQVAALYLESSSPFSRMRVLPRS